jgi:2-hydroxychromene-2-carboxylate isomerase
VGGKLVGETLVTKTVDFIFDFASPNAYFAHHVLKAICVRRGAAMNVLPCLLGGIFKATNNQAPMIAFGPVKGKMAYEMLETDRFIKKHRLERFKFNPHFPVNTLTVMRGLIAAEMDGVKDKYIDVVLKAMWEDGENMADPATISRVLAAGGLDAARLVEMTQNPEVKEKLAANTNAAVERGAFGIPTFYVGKEMFFGKERLGQVEEMLG